MTDTATHPPKTGACTWTQTGEPCGEHGTLMDGMLKIYRCPVHHPEGER